MHFRKGRETALSRNFPRAESTYYVNNPADEINGLQRMGYIYKIWCVHGGEDSYCGHLDYDSV
jgi:hypothetical protein